MTTFNTGDKVIDKGDGEQYVVVVSTPDSDGDIMVTNEMNQYVVLSPDELQAPPREIVAVCWINVYPDGKTSGWPSKQTADKFGDDDRVECRRVTFTVTEGEGIDGK